MTRTLPNFLPGKLTLEPGSPRDYIVLEQFHYLPKRPATWARVWRITYTDRSGTRVIAAGVLSFPVPCSRGRQRVFNNAHLSYGRKIRFANANFRTISRIVVHPQFRSLGLATLLVECLIENCPTRYVEASAMMARAHPFFERAGMKRVDPDNSDDPIYFIFDRGERLSLAA